LVVSKHGTKKRKGFGVTKSGAILLQVTATQHEHAVRVAKGVKAKGAKGVKAGITHTESQSWSHTINACAIAQTN